MTMNLSAKVCLTLVQGVQHHWTDGASCNLQEKTFSGITVIMRYWMRHECDSARVAFTKIRNVTMSDCLMNDIQLNASSCLEKLNVTVGGKRWV